MRMIGTTTRGLRAPIIHEGDNLVKIVVNSVLQAAEQGGYDIQDRDILAITESILARAQGNYVSFDEVQQDIKNKFEGSSIGVVFPILSRNRFNHNLKGVARAADKVIIQLQYPSDEVGNRMVDRDDLEKQGVNPWTDVLTEEEFREKFPNIDHLYTGVDYIDLYRQTVEAENCECEIILSNQPETILDYTDQVLVSDIHNRAWTKSKIIEAGGKVVLTLEDIMNQPLTEDGGYNEEFGLLGSNYASDSRLKLFPRHSQEFVEEVQRAIKDETGKTIEVMIYGDGAYKDPAGGIWEMADPVVSPGHTSGLEGTPNEVKLKKLADQDFSDLEGEQLTDQVTDYLRERKKGKIETPETTDMASDMALGTTPRQISDLLGSLADLTSGSGDKGTPFVYIQGYFDNFADE